MPALVSSRREGALLYVALDRPEKRNAIHRELLLALVDAIAAAEREPDVRALVVYGEGPVFSAGVDFGMLTGDTAGELALPFRTLIGDMQAALSRLEALEKPVIGALHRYVPGLALELALAFDLRVATADAELGLPEVRVGLVPDVGGTTRLVRTVGYAKAKELILTGRMIGAAEALAIGLVNQVVPPGEHVAAAARLAEEIAQNAPLAVGLAKRLVDLGSNVDKHTFLAMELLAQSVLLRSEDAREGARALAERRPPRFSGRGPVPGAAAGRPAGLPCGGTPARSGMLRPAGAAKRRGQPRRHPAHPRPRRRLSPPPSSTRAGCPPAARAPRGDPRSR